MTESIVLYPPAKHLCPVCGFQHADDLPHDATMAYYRSRFRALRGRVPTWADAIAHCRPDVRADWERQLKQHDEWTEPENGDPIADPPAESFHQLIDMNHYKQERMA